MAVLCAPPWGRAERDALAMTREYAFNVLFCRRDDEGMPLM
jgi:hypothetical protein